MTLAEFIEYRASFGPMKDWSPPVVEHLIRTRIGVSDDNGLVETARIAALAAEFGYGPIK